MRQQRSAAASHAARAKSREGGCRVLTLVWNPLSDKLLAVWIFTRRFDVRCFPLHATSKFACLLERAAPSANAVLLIAPQLAAAPQSRACLSRRAVAASVLCCSSLALPSATAIPSEEDVGPWVQPRWAMH